MKKCFSILLAISMIFNCIIPVFAVENEPVGQILHYDMSSSGETVADTAGDYDGTLVGTTAWVDGVDGYGVHVAGGEDYISVPREAFLQSQDVTFSAWVKLDSVAPNTTILSIGDGSTNKMLLSVNDTPNGSVGMTAVLQQSGQSETYITAGNCMNPTVNEWAHVAYTQTGSTAALYLNGERIQQITNMTGTIKGILEASENATVRIGDNHINENPSMVGTISDIEVYGCALSAEEIRTKYDEKLASGAVLHYEMTQTGEQVTDSVGSYHGTLVGNAVWTDGMNGKAVHVAGGADYISIPREALMQSDDVTVSMWVKLDSISTWTTLFSVGNGSSNYMLLSVMGNPFGQSVGVTAAIKENGGEEVRVSAASGVNPAIGDWALVTYAQSGSVATLYLNGEQVAQVENMTGTIKGVLEASDVADVRVGDNQIFGDPSTVGAIGEVLIKNRGPLGDEIAEAYLAKKDAELILHYDMNTEGEMVTDSVGDYDGTLNGNTSWVEGIDANAVHVGGADNDYIGVPREALLQAEAVTFSAWINLENIGTWTTILGIGNNASNYMLLAAKGAPYSKEVGLTVAIKENGGAEVRVSAETSSQPTVGKWTLVTYTQIGNVATIYLDGKQVAQTTGMLGSIKGVLEASQDADIRIGDNQIYGDPSMAAAIADVMIYKGAVTPEVLQAEVAVKADIIEQKFIEDEAEALDLGDLSNVTEDIVLPIQTANGLSVTWDSNNPTFVDAEGKVNFPTAEQGNQEIVLTATVSNQDGTKAAKKTFTFTIYVLTDERVVEQAADYVQRYMEYLINDGYELLTGKNMDTYTGKSYACDIQWELTDGEAEIQDGKIVKTVNSAERQPIKLKAIVTKGESSKEVVFENVTLIDEYVGYIMSFFGGNDGLQTLHLGFSYDGFNWKPLNDGLSVHTPEGGSGVVRDPYILRKKDGSFCVVATNDWNNPTIYLWDSEDLVSYTNERVSTVAYEGEVGLTGARAWAPEAVYDPIKDEYTVFWSDPYANGNNGNIYGNTSKDLEEFSHPFEFFTTDYTIIDANIIKWRGVNYMVFKDETGNNSGTAGGKVIYMAKSDSLEAGSFEQYTGAITEILVEGPFMFKLINEEKWVHYYDYFNEHKFGVSTSTDLDSGEWEFLGKSTTMPTNDVRHGGVVAVTQKEMDRILEGYNYKEPAEENVEGEWFYLSDFAPMEEVTTGWDQTDYLSIDSGLADDIPDLYLCTKKATSADNAVKFTKGMSIQAPGKITYDISDMNATRFTCIYGVNAKHGSGLGTVGLKIYTDLNAPGEYLYCLNSAEDAERLGVDSFPIGQLDKAVTVDIAIPEGATKLYIEPTDGGNGADSDHAVIAEPRLYADYAYLSNMEHTEISTGWGDPLYDTAFDGPIILNTLYKGNANGVTRMMPITCTEGITIHAPSSVTYNIDGMQVSRFTAFCGISTNSGDYNPTTTFKVFFDGVEVYSIDKMRDNANIAIGENIDLKVPEGTKTITLTAQAVGSNDGNHSCWAYPRLFGDNLDRSPVAGIYENGQLVASYASVSEAVAAANGEIVTILADTAEKVTISADVTIDLAGCKLSNVTVSDNATLKLIDSATDDYEGEYGAASVSGSVAGGENYLVVSENGLYSAHRYDVAITHISLKPDADALGYKAQLKGDAVVQSHVESFGFNLWVGEDNVKTYGKADTDIVTLRLKGILAANGGEMPIYAEAFVNFTNGQTVKSDAYSTTMKQTLQAVDSAWTTYSEVQQDAVLALCKQYQDVTSEWELDNIFSVINIPIA